MDEVIRVEKGVYASVTMRRLLDGRSIIIGTSAGVLSVVVALLVLILTIAFQDPLDSSIYTLQNFRDLYLDPFVYKTLLNTAGFTIVATLTALFFAIPIAWLAERTDLPGRSWVFPIMTASAVIPGLFSALGWLFMFHPRMGLVNRWLVDVVPFIHTSPFNIISVPGMGFITGLSLSSLAFIMLAATFRAMDPALEESAQIHGMTFALRLWKITLPLMWPGILAVGIYIATIGLASFDVPAVIGLANRIFTFSTFVYYEADPLEGPPNFSIVGASSVFMIIVWRLLSW